MLDNEGLIDSSSLSACQLLSFTTVFLCVLCRVCGKVCLHLGMHVYLIIFQMLWCTPDWIHRQVYFAALFFNPVWLTVLKASTN